MQTVSTMIVPDVVTLQGFGIKLEPLSLTHLKDLEVASADGKLWELWFTAVPDPGKMETYISEALREQRAGRMLAWAVREMSSGTIVGSTRFHDIEPEVERLYIGYTWYRATWQHTHVNTACKLVLLEHAFGTLGAQVVGLRTDSLNFASQRAITALGAKKEGVLRHHQLRRDGTVRDSVMFSILAVEWPDVQRHLKSRLARLLQQPDVRRRLGSELVQEFDKK
ncbi:MAG: GNAT family N-acetyltransferase [Gemmatimonadaceae bacterium]